MSGNRIHVVARLRPEPNSREPAGERVVAVDAAKKTISVPVRKQARSARDGPDHSADGWSFALDAILDEGCSQPQAFEATVAPLVDAVLDGYNSTVLAYGQTGAGKTYTMMGPSGAGSVGGYDERGACSRALGRLFASVARRAASEPHATVAVRLSCMEIYNESLYDLLAPPADGPQRPGAPARNEGAGH